MTFPRIRAAGMWTLGSVLSPSEEEAFDDHQSKAIDGYAGGAYAPSAPIVVGASGGNTTGIHVTSILQADQLNATVPSGLELHFLSGSFLQTEAGANVLFNSGVAFTGNTAFGGATNTVIGGTWGFYENAYQLGGFTFHVGDATNGVGHLLIDGSVAGAGSDLTLKGNAVATWLGGTGAIFSGGSAASFAAGATLTTDQPASTTDVGANNIKVLGVARAWAEIHINGSTSPAVNDGYGVFSVTATSTSVTVTFAHDMGNPHYDLSFSTESFTSTVPVWPLPFFKAKDPHFFTVEFRSAYTASPWTAGDVIDPTAALSNFVFCFSTRGRQ